MAIAIECTHERIIIIACHCADFNVSIQTHHFVFVALCAFGDIIRKDFPVIRRLNDKICIVYPLHKIGLACLDASGISKVKRQRAIVQIAFVTV